MRPQHGGPGAVVEMDALRITGCPEGASDCEAEVYDAGDLFARATVHLNAERCREAVVDYDRLVAEFPGHPLESAAYYNAGLCLQALADFQGAADHFGVLREKLPDSEDYLHASFQYAEVLVQLERWDEVMQVSDELMAREDLEAFERLEAMARRSQGLLGKGELKEAARHAKSALSYFRIRKDTIPDEFFAAANNYVLAETLRIEAQAMGFPEGTEAQKTVLIGRAELLLQAQREYFNTMSFNNLDNLHWASASIYRIGHMYDELWHAVMEAPVPAHLPPEGHDIYHRELASLIKPLIRHAIRYWELSQMLIERTGMKNEWAKKTRQDLERVRALLLEQPPGPGGIPAGTSQPQVGGAEAPSGAPPEQTSTSSSGDMPAPGAAGTATVAQPGDG